MEIERGMDQYIQHSNSPFQDFLYHLPKGIVTGIISSLCVTKIIFIGLGVTLLDFVYPLWLKNLTSPFLALDPVHNESLQLRPCQIRGSPAVASVVAPGAACRPVCTTSWIQAYNNYPL